MKKIPFTQFIRLLTSHQSARIGRQFINGPKHVPCDADVAEAVKTAGDLNFRSVEHTQTNAIRFTGGSWLMFKCPAHTKRTCYACTMDGVQYLVSVNYRESYENGFGTPIAEQNIIIIYQLRTLPGE